MKKLICLLIIYFITSFVFAQNQVEIDSLENLMATAKTGTERLEILQELFLIYESPSKREYYYEEAKRNAKEMRDETTLAHLQFMEAKVKCDKKIYSNSLLELGNNVFTVYKKQKVAEKYVIRALDLMADIYQLNNQIKVAVDYNLQTIKAIEKSKILSIQEKESLLGISYIKLANKTSILKDAKAVEYSTKGIRMLEKKIQLEGLVGVYGNHCIVLRRAQLYDSALVYAQKIYTILDNSKTDQNTKKAKLAYMIATIYIEMKKIDLAIEYAEKSFVFLENEKPKKEVEMAMSYYLLGKLYQQKQQFPKAILYLDKTIEIGNKYNLLDLLYNSNLKLSEIYKSQNNTDKAYFYLDKTTAYLDSINNKRRETDTKELVQKYETEKKEQQIKDLEQQKIIEDLKNKQEVAELEKQRSILGLVLLAPISLLIGGGWYVNRRRLHLKLEAEQKERAKQLSELKALRSQMNPHFIFNALNSIQDFILLSEKENASFYLGKFATLMRGFLESSSKEKISLDTELSLIKSYIELEGLRLGEEFSYEIIFDKIDEEELEDIEIPPLLIQPYLENAFKHGLLHKTGNKKLTLEFSKLEKSNQPFLELKITDNGVGRQKSAEINARKAKTHNSFATQATNERLELMKNQSTTNKNIEVKINDLKDIQDNAKGTEIVILIPINNY